MRLTPVDGPGAAGPAAAENDGCTGPPGTVIRFGPSLRGAGGCRVSMLAPPKLDVTWPVPERGFATEGPVAEIVEFAVGGPEDMAGATAIPTLAATGLRAEVLPDGAVPPWLL
jgi:hypothetical protein